MCIFKRQYGNLEDIYYVAINRKYEQIAKIHKSGMGWDVFQGDGPMHKGTLLDTFERLVDAKHFVSQGFIYHGMQQGILGTWRKKED